MVYFFLRLKKNPLYLSLNPFSNVNKIRHNYSRISICIQDVTGERMDTTVMRRVNEYAPLEMVLVTLLRDLALRYDIIPLLQNQCKNTKNCSSHC